MQLRRRILKNLKHATHNLTGPQKSPMAPFIGRVKEKELKARFEKGRNGEELRVIGGEEVRVTFTITEAFRGVSGKEVDVFTSDGSAACGYNFDRGGTYIVYAHEYPSRRSRSRIAGARKSTSGRWDGRLSGTMFDAEGQPATRVQTLTWETANTPTSIGMTRQRTPRKRR
jgi:hypothetical protein